MADVRDRLMSLLDGKGFHSGTKLGSELGISRAAVHKHIVALQASGLSVDSVAGRGYRLHPEVELLNAARIRAALPPATAADISGLHIERALDSTSSYLRDLPVDDVRGHICLAESQSAGRGRRGNEWVASPYRNLLMSIGWTYAGWPPDLAALSLAVGVMLIDSVSAAGAPGVGLKWPNDLVWRDQKLGGILVDVRGESGGPCTLIIGIGINVVIDQGGAAAINQPWVDLKRVSGHAWDRNMLAASCISQIWDLMSTYESTGFRPYRDLWAKYDVLSGRGVELLEFGKSTRIGGVVQGIDDSGALRVLQDDGTEIRCYQGEVSVRRR